MRKPILIALVPALLCGIAVGASSQQRLGFTTRVAPDHWTAGTVVQVAAVIPNTQVKLADRRCLFLLGLRYNPRLGPFVIPPIILGVGTFKKEKVGRKDVLVAKMRFQVPKRLPKGLKVNLYLQGVAAIQGRGRPAIAFSTPAQALLQTRP
jgi:hypothetical protein